MGRAIIGDTMRTAAIILMFIVVPWSLAFADQATCTHIAQQAEQAQRYFSPVEGYQVVGTGRLYFHTAPHAHCRSKEVFVIPGDHLIAYTEYQGWVSVMYINPKTSQDSQGWVPSQRLKFTGTMGLKN
jgi:hypothetical protein